MTSKVFPRPTGDIQGDSREIPDRGVRTSVTETYGGNLEQGYQNEGSITGSTGSDPADQCHSGKNNSVGNKQ